jgi:hypothetical protein
MSFSMLSSAPNIPSQTLRAPDLYPLDTIPSLLHTKWRIRMALRPTLSIHGRHSTPRPIHPRTRLRTTVHLNRAARHPNTKEPTPPSPSAKHPTPPPRSSQILPTYSNTTATTNTTALTAAAAPDVPRTPMAVTTSTASQKTISRQLRTALTFVLAHLRKRSWCEVRIW